ncbi:glycosyltransferase [Psychromonas sp. RZ22]|uniref:glycosyltransferase n=1 Tax=Psychromonas algarum TaxID=2555643 RepID=UPI0010689BE2|nr:glycosyltransferase [Psychromonas sp. RZ22]TEW55748.1 glycosyltransferase [Psychromonas sp. RZ22]
MSYSEVKKKLIVFRLKNNAFKDPVDRLRGLDVLLKLRERGWNVEFFNEQRDIDLMISLGFDFKCYCDINSFKPKKLILDVQDDHLTSNKEALKKIPGNRFGKYKRAFYIFNERGIWPVMAIFLYKTISKVTFKKLAEKADLLITSSYALEKKLNKINLNICTIPDSIDYKLYLPNLIPNNSDTISIVWVGTASNIKYLLLINDSLKNIQAKYNVSIKIVTSRQIFVEPTFNSIVQSIRFDFDFIEWEQDTFGEHLFKADIGIAPLPVGIAKSSNKILSYMASGLAVLCSGSIDYKLLHNENPNAFYFSNDFEEWEAILERLILDREKASLTAKQGNSLAKSFDIDALVEEYEKKIISLF